ncbi:hypothetical protein [Ruegeria lacuscaerulensis]|uniref:hypothetical protein n=1 Tax=Ruegeria lacuscaerulensis TaxID=55218 RepID=UPI00147A26BC|nr:hypothetical protein [Ruegeria lacuscaerulensis]
MTARSDITLVFWLTLLCLGTLMATYGPFLSDPFVRHDDFPALLGHFDMAYSKALDEGRWLNFWWQFRPFLWPAPVNFALYLLGWSIFSACTAIIVLGRSMPAWFLCVMALFVALSRPAFLISFWFNTLLPGIWVLALFSLAVVFLSHRASVLLLIVAVPLSFMAYTTYPFMMLSLVLLSRKAPQTYVSAGVTLVVFFASLALAFGVVYSLNFLHHGVFDIPVAEWRDPTEVKSISDLALNYQKLKLHLYENLHRVGSGSLSNGVFLVSLFAVSWLYLFRRQRYVATIVLVAVLAGCGPLFAKTLTSGLKVPFRALGWNWILFGYTLTMSVFILTSTSTRLASVARIVIMCVLLIATIQFGRITYGTFPLWQKTTRALADEIPDGMNRVQLYGSYYGLEGARETFIQFDRGLRLRLEYLTGAEVVSCDTTPDECTDATPPFDPLGWTHTSLVETDGTVAFVLLPSPPVGP